jgi:membrane peptidoglycan carboxypeptidase
VSQAVADEVTGVLKQITGNDAVAGAGRESAGKTGTWENWATKPDGSQQFPGTNAHAWFTGFTSQISATIWIGSKDYNATPLMNPNGTNMGSAYPRSLWKKFMDQVHKDLNLPAAKLPSSRGTGDQGRGTRPSPSPSPSPGCYPSCPTPDPDPTPTPTEADDNRVKPTISVTPHDPQTSQRAGGP